MERMLMLPAKENKRAQRLASKRLRKNLTDSVQKLQDLGKKAAKAKKATGQRQAKKDKGKKWPDKRKARKQRKRFERKAKDALDDLMLSVKALEIQQAPQNKNKNNNKNKNKIKIKNKNKHKHKHKHSRTASSYLSSPGLGHFFGILGRRPAPRSQNSGTLPRRRDRSDMPWTPDARATSPPSPTPPAITVDIDISLEGG